MKCFDHTPFRIGLFYGSLDRSWARRARSGSTSKKRPELQNIDFGVDRERPISPAPIAAETVNRAASEEVARPRYVFHYILFRWYLHLFHFTIDFNMCTIIFTKMVFGLKLILILFNFWLTVVSAVNSSHNFGHANANFRCTLYGQT